MNPAYVSFSRRLGRAFVFLYTVIWGVVNDRIHSLVVRVSSVLFGGRAFDPWAGTDIYVPAMLRSEYLLANKGYAQHEWRPLILIVSLGLAVLEANL